MMIVDDLFNKVGIVYRLIMAMGHTLAIWAERCAETFPKLGRCFDYLCSLSCQNDERAITCPGGSCLGKQRVSVCICANQLDQQLFLRGAHVPDTMSKLSLSLSLPPSLSLFQHLLTYCFILPSNVILCAACRGKAQTVTRR